MSRKRRKTTSNRGTKYVNLYPESMYNKDEKNFEQAMTTGKVDYSGFKRLMIRDLALNHQLIETESIGDVKFDDIKMYLKHPKQGWRYLLAVSNELMHISPHYYKLNQMYSNMALFDWGVDVYDVRDNVNMDSLKKLYHSLSAKLESMCLKHEFSKIMKVLPYQDIYCGLIVENKNDFFIQQVHYGICKLYEVQDGLYNFIINLSAIRPQTLSAYPDYIQQAYLDFRDNKADSYWYEPPADKQICIKLNSQWLYPYPILIGLVRDILDLDIYKKLKLQSARTDNYKAIMVEVPIDEKTIDKPLLTPETLAIFAEINRESMNDDIGLIHTLGSKGEAISFKDSTNTRNNVSDAIDELYNSSGDTQELFNGSSTATAINMSIENTAGFIYGLYRQFERWTNRYIKLRNYNKSTFKFSFYLLDITIFNRDTVSKRYKDAITLGTPVVDKYLATLDMTPSKVLGAYIIHNDIFDYVNKFQPLKTSYNSSEDDVGGRPTKASQGETLGDEGERTADNDRNKR